ATTVWGPLRSSSASRIRETLRTTTTITASATRGTSSGISTRSRNSFIEPVPSSASPPHGVASLFDLPLERPPTTGLPVVLLVGGVPLEEQHGDEHPQQQPAPELHQQPGDLLVLPRRQPPQPGHVLVEVVDRPVGEDEERGGHRRDDRLQEQVQHL